jgi:hypothetical protein
MPPFQPFPPASMILSPCVTLTGDPSASVQGINTTTLADGALVYCEGSKTTFRLDKADAATAPDGTSVIQPAAGPGRWKAFGVIGGTGIVWRPDGLGDVTTWAEVMAAVAANKGPVTIYVPQQTTYVIDPGPPPATPVVYEMNGARIVAPRGPHDNVRVQIRRGATLHNLSAISGGFRLQANKNVGDPQALTFDAAAPGQTTVFVIEDGAELHSLSNALAPMLLVPDSTSSPEFYLVFDNLGTAQSDAPAPPVVQAQGTSVLKIVVLAGGLSLDTVQPANWFGSAVGALVGWVHDGSMTFPQNFWTGYHPNNLGTNFNMALGQCGGMGPSLYRPVDQNTGSAISIGCMYLDTTLAGGLNLGVPIWWTGGGWVNATGAGPL